MTKSPEWRDVNALLSTHVPPGWVTTYSSLSRHLYGRMLIHPVTSLLKACSANAAVDYSHRVVMDDGALSPQRAGGPDRQRQLLIDEGVTFSTEGRVDFRSTPCVDLRSSQ